MKPGLANQLHQLLQTLTPRQRTLDFADPCRWEQLPAADRRACRDAIAALLQQVITTQENVDHE
jgi:hypothetical protein